MSKKTSWKRYVKDPNISLYELTQSQAAEMICEFVSGTEKKFDEAALYEFMYSAHPDEDWTRRLISTLDGIDRNYATKSEFNGLLSPGAREELKKIVFSLKHGAF